VILPNFIDHPTCGLGLANSDIDGPDALVVRQAEQSANRGTLVATDLFCEESSAWLDDPPDFGDTVRLVTSALTAPSIHVVTCYGVSRNTRRFYTDDGWAELGYDPQDDAEQFAHRWPGADPWRYRA
jgi:hypothetical protein